MGTSSTPTADARPCEGCRRRPSFLEVELQAQREQPSLKNRGRTAQSGSERLETLRMLLALSMLKMSNCACSLRPRTSTFFASRTSIWFQRSRYSRPWLHAAAP